jgi:hypothetical protein
MPGWPDWPAALAAVHKGDLESAARHPDAIEEVIQRQFPERTFPGFRQQGWRKNAHELRRLIVEAPERIPAHCEAVAQQAIKERKLEKYWQPTPFWGPADRKRALSSRSKR